MHAIAILSRFIQASTMHHYCAIKRILRYVNGTVSYGLHYMNNDKFKLISYYDSDWRGSPNNRKSTTGWVFTLGFGAVAWYLRKQKKTAL